LKAIELGREAKEAVQIKDIFAGSLCSLSRLVGRSKGRQLNHARKSVDENPGVCQTDQVEFLLIAQVRQINEYP
jgi:hypothetical protein